ncbi:MAG: helicase SNF2, partial [Pseudomonadota bacterium]|nr:helicase SNF2 [Pseudomonadota bacterium]
MTPALLHQLLQHAEWASHFDEVSLQRAADYARRQRVTEVLFDADGQGDGCALDGVVRGSARLPYQCRVEISAGKERLALTTHCDCPVRQSCKHAAAMLLLAANLPPEAWPGTRADAKPAPKKVRATPPARRQVSAAARQPVGRLAPSGKLDDLLRLLQLRAEERASGNASMQPWTQWLQRFEPRPAEVTKQADSRRQFGILLRSDETNHRLLVSPMWLRPGKTSRASLVDPQPLRMDDRSGPVPAPTGGWSDGVDGALAVLLHDQFVRLSAQYWTAIQASYQEQALETVLAHHPVYFEKGSSPLQRGPALPLQTRWNALPDGSQQLVASVDVGEKPLLLRGAGLWYVQPLQQTYGRVYGDPQLLDSIESAPPVQPEHVEALRQQLQQRDAELPIPLPEPRGDVHQIDAEPIPVLDVRRINLGVRGRGGKRKNTAFGCARLSYDYGGHLLAPDIDEGFGRPNRILRDGEVLEIRRDLTAEQAAEDQLGNLGMVEARIYAIEQGIRKHALEQSDFVLQPSERQLPLAPADWKPTLDRLMEAGFRIDYDDDFPRDELVQIDDWHAGLEAHGNQWFDVSLGVDVSGERIDLLPLLRRLVADASFPRKPV